LIKLCQSLWQWDLEKDTPNLYLKCGDSYKNLMVLFLANKPTDLFSRKASGEIGLKAYNGLILGKNGKAMLFDGKTEYITADLNESIFDGKHGETILFFIKWKSGEASISIDRWRRRYFS